MNPTKLVATLGPASASRETIRAFLETGLDVARLNFSHGDHASHERVVALVREEAGRLGRHVALMGDLCGPKIRVGEIGGPGIILVPGQRNQIVRGDIIGDAARFGTNFERFVDDVDIGHRVLIDDGQILLEVEDRSPDALICICRRGGPVSSGKGIILPDTRLNVPSLTERDLSDLQWAIGKDLDYIALSFVRAPKDVHALRQRIAEFGSEARIVSKIETPEAIAGLSEIIEASDAVLVARGDLGVTLDLTRVPILQKEIIEQCTRAGKPVIVATQMLQTMIDQPVPTRAEVSDVANAVFDKADAVMLSAETAVGHYPVESLATMNRITRRVAEFERSRAGDQGFGLNPTLRVGEQSDRTTAAVARSAANVAGDLGASWIAVWSRSGTTATWISKHRPSQPLIGLSHDPVTCRRLALCYGIVPFLVHEENPDPRDLLQAVCASLDLPSAGPGKDSLVLLVGNPKGTRREPVVSIHALR